MAKVKSVSLGIEVVSPLLMGGYNPLRAEVRPSSIKGLIRWWYRELFKESCYDYSQVFQRERDIFGGALNLTEKSQSSKVRVEVQTDDIKSSPIHKWLNEGRGNSYLLRHFTKMKNGKSRGAILPGSRFTLRMTFDHSMSETDIVDVLKSLWASIYLGGWGYRSRRGTGSVKVIDWDNGGWDTESISSYFLIDKSSSLDAFLHNAVEWFDGSKNGNIFEFTLCVKTGVVNTRFNSVEDALNVLGEKWQSVRRGMPLLERISLGLPIGRYLRRERSSLMYNWLVKGERGDTLKGRLASPLILKVWKIGRGYRIGATLVKKCWIRPYDPSHLTLRNCNVKGKVGHKDGGRVSIDREVEDLEDETLEKTFEKFLFGGGA